MDSYLGLKSTVIMVQTLEVEALCGYHLPEGKFTGGGTSSAFSDLVPLRPKESE